MSHISTWLNCRLLCVAVAQWVLLPHSQQKPHGWVKDNRGHLLSVYFLWCSATQLCCQNTQGYPRALCSARGPAHRGTFIAYWLHWEVPKPRRNSGGVLKRALLLLHRYTTVPLTLIGAAWWNTEKLSALWDSDVVPLSYIKSKLISGWVNWIAEYLSSCWGAEE